MRALAVALVLAFHLQTGWMPGGYLGVSVFFTLSGYLITSLLLSERAADGRIDVQAFYVRRLRRLQPAAMVCVALVTVLAATGALANDATLPADLRATLFQYANWHALLSGHSYASLFQAPSPVAHFWSLAIEEQFYLLWPVTMVGLTAWAARRPDRSRMTPALVTLFVLLSVSAPLTARWWSADAAYFASWARFAEIVAGAALAAALVGRELPERARVLAPVCLVAIVLLCVASPSGRGWAYEGWLPLFALLSVGLITGLQVDGPVRSALSARPAVWVGQVSYGLYVFHWPVFSVLDQQRTGLDGAPLVAVRLGASFALAAVSHRMLERPIRLGRLVPRTSAYLTSAAAIVAALVIAAAFVPAQGRPADSAGAVVLAAASSPTTPTTPDAAASSAPSNALTKSISSAGATSPAAHAAQSMVGRVTPKAVTPRTIAVFGDSVPDWLMRDAAASFSRTDVTLIDSAHEACDGALNPPRERDRRGTELFAPASCQPWTTAYPPVVTGPLPVDMALLVIGGAPLLDRLVGFAWVGPCTDMAWYESDVRDRIGYLEQHVAHVVLVLPSWGGKGSTWSLPDDHLAREACVRDRLRVLAKKVGAAAIDFADELCPLGPTEPCSDLRQGDGMHVDPQHAPEVLNWLLDHALAVAGQTRS